MNLLNQSDFKTVLSDSSNPLMQHLFSHRQGKLVKQACWLDKQNALLLETRWKVKKEAIALFGDNFSITTWCVYFNAQGHFSHVTLQQDQPWGDSEAFMLVWQVLIWMCYCQFGLGEKIDSPRYRVSFKSDFFNYRIDINSNSHFRFNRG